MNNNANDAILSRKVDTQTGILYFTAPAASVVVVVIANDNVVTTPLLIARFQKRCNRKSVCRYILNGIIASISFYSILSSYHA